ncbi:MAG: nicotinate phosphoribosyltransferase [Candidatus Kaelpia aquatica]|nr:nicotinate phosphoribosyltransferase [Candidatus Kaelpia aquatica]
MFHIASSEEIKRGDVSDIYFLRTREILKKENISKRVAVEFTAKLLPKGYTWGLFSGLEEAFEVLNEIKGIDVYAVREGTFFGANDPVMRIEGRYEDFGLYETALLGLLCQASGVATKAARCKIAALDKPLYSFGARRIHPAIAPMIERNAYLGGCDGVACAKSAAILGLKAVGTIPHALVLLFGDTVKATEAFDRVIDSDVNRIALIDTFNDEKFEALNVAEALKDKIFGIRLDTPASRRGNFIEILKEVKWELELRGFKDIKILVSGGIDEDKIKELNPYVDSYGVGTSISNAPVLDFAMDIVEIDGQPIAKRGKLSGVKRLFRCSDCFSRTVEPLSVTSQKCSCGNDMEDILKPLIKDGKPALGLDDIAKSRDYVLSQFNYFKEDL